MKIKTLTTVALLAVIALVTPTTVLSQPNRTTGSFVPGFWQPKAQINPNRPITVMLMNETGFDVRYSLSPYPDSSLAPGSMSQVYVDISKRTGDIASINIYSSEELMYDYNADNNQLMVRIRPSGSTTRADKAVYIDETGRVYSF